MSEVVLMGLQVTCPLCNTSGRRPNMMDAIKYPCGTMRYLRARVTEQSEKCKENVQRIKTNGT